MPPWIAFFLSGVCNQLPEHSLQLQGQALPICARCTGMFGGIVLTLLVLAIAGRLARRGFPSRGVLAVLGGLMVLWALDGVNSLVSDRLAATWLYQTSNATRLITGTFCGVAVGTMLFSVIGEALRSESLAEPALSGWGERLAVVGAASAFVAAMLLWQAAPYWLGALISVGAVGVVFLLVNALLVALLLNRKLRPVQYAVVLLAGLAASLAETGALASLRWLLVRG